MWYSRSLCWDLVYLFAHRVFGHCTDRTTDGLTDDEIDDMCKEEVSVAMVGKEKPNKVCACVQPLPSLHAIFRSIPFSYLHVLRLCLSYLCVSVQTRPGHYCVRIAYTSPVHMLCRSLERCA